MLAFPRETPRFPVPYTFLYLTNNGMLNTHRRTSVILRSYLGTSASCRPAGSAFNCVTPTK